MADVTASLQTNVLGTRLALRIPHSSPHPRTLVGSYYFGHGPVSSFKKNDTILFYFGITVFALPSLPQIWRTTSATPGELNLNNLCLYWLARWQDFKATHKQ